MEKFEKALKLASIRLANIHLENGFGAPPSPGKVRTAFILAANRYGEE